MKLPSKVYHSRFDKLKYNIISKIYSFYWVFKEKSISAMIRVKNGEEFLKESIESIISVCDEVVIINNRSTDKTSEVIKGLQRLYSKKIKVYKYDHDVTKVGEDSYDLYKIDPKSPKLTHNFYNWCLEKTSYPFILKWDDDMIATDELIKSIISFKRSKYLQYNFGGVNVAPDHKSSYQWHAGSEPRISPKFLSTYKYSDYNFVEGSFGGEYIEQWVSCKEVLIKKDSGYLHLKYCKQDPVSNQSKEFASKIGEKLIVSGELSQEDSKVVDSIYRLKSTIANINNESLGEKKKLKIAIVGGSWSSNIGNAFYNVGAEWVLKQLGHDVSFYPESPRWKRDVNDSYDPVADLDVDLVILMGPCLKDRLAYVYENTFKKLYQRNIKVGYLSAGMAVYTQSEADLVEKIFNRYPPAFISTRDHECYRFFVNRVSCPIYSGICASMFLSDAIHPLKLAKNPYIVYNFDQVEPLLEIDTYGVASVQTPSNNQPPSSHLNLDIIRTNNLSIDEGYDLIYRRPNVYHSDLPQGYCSILAGAQTVYSERLHTCAATLIYGRPAQYIPNSSRSYEKRNLIFDRIGVPEIFLKPQYLDMNYISKEKSEMMKFLNKVIPA